MKFSDYRVTDESQIICWDNLLKAGRDHNFKVLKIDENKDFHDCDIMVVGGSDYPFMDYHSSMMNLKSLKLCLANNLMFSHPKFLTLPVGLPQFSYDKIIGNKNVILKLVSDTKKRKNLVYKNFKIETNRQCRSALRDIKAKHITEDVYDRSEKGYMEYVKGIHSHDFTICPAGNGIDTHRIWEAIYLGSIPIVKLEDQIRPIRFVQNNTMYSGVILTGNRIQKEHFAHLPILFIDSWSQILNVDFLEEKYEEFHRKEWELQRCTMQYYIELIHSNRKMIDTCEIDEKY